tara:strand:+ start:2879 stop:8776 length:5898 start_codon:yes stop_codon:yes gene_type:complete
MYSKDGYKRYSKDRNNPFNIIPSGNITMEDVDFPVFGMDNLGNSEIMMPGATYTFPGNEVFEMPLPQAQVGTAIRKGLQALKNFRKSPEITDDLVNRLSQSDEFKVIDSQIPNVNQTKTIVNDVVDKPYIDINTVKTIEQRAVDFIEKEIIKKADNLPKGITLDQVNHATGEIIISSKKRKPFTYKLNKTEQKRLTDFFFKQADKEGLFKPKLQSSRQMAIDMDWFYNPATKRMETRGSFLGLSGYTPDLLPDGRNFVKFLDELDQKYINRGHTINPNPAKEEFYLGIDRKVADRFLSTLQRFGVNTITGKQLKTVFPEGFYHGSSERINKLSDITLQPTKNVKSGDKTISGFYGTSNPQYAAGYMDWRYGMKDSNISWTNSPYGSNVMYGPAKNRTLHSIDIADDAVVGFTGGRQIEGGYKFFDDFKDKGVDIVLGKASIGDRVMNHNEILFLNKKGIKNFNPIEPSTSILGQGTKIDDLINVDPTAYKLMMSGKMDEGQALLDKYYRSYGKSPLGPTVELPGGINAIEGGVGMTPVGGYGWNLKDIPKLDLMLDTRYGPKIKLPHRFNPDLDQYFRISREGPLWKEGGDLPKAQSGLKNIPRALKGIRNMFRSGKNIPKIIEDIPNTYKGPTISSFKTDLSFDNIMKLPDDEFRKITGSDKQYWELVTNKNPKYKQRLVTAYDNIWQPSDKIVDMIGAGKNEVANFYRSADYKKRLMDGMKISSKEADEIIDDLIKEMDNATIRFNNAPLPNDGIAMGSSGSPTGSVTFTDKMLNMSDDQIMDIIKHEFGHVSLYGQGRGPAGKLINTLETPRVKSSTAKTWTESNSKNLLDYHNTPDEIRQRAMNALQYMQKNNMSVDDFMGMNYDFVVNNVRSGKMSQDLLDLRQYFDPAEMKDYLNKAFSITAPIGIGASTLSSWENSTLEKEKGGDLPQAQFGIPSFLKNIFKKTIDDIPVPGKVVDNIDIDNLKTFTGETGPSSFSNIVENPNKLSIDNIEGDLIRRDKGKYLTFDENGNLISTARSTHFTGTGAPVESHFMGNWDDAITTIDLPLKDAIKSNPGQIRTSAIGDTYFYEPFNYPKSANIFTGDYQLFNQLKKSGYNVELSKESMDIFRQINSLRPKIINETATAAEKELFEQLAKRNADIHNQFIKSRNLTAVNPNDPNIPLGWEKYNPYKTEQRSIRSDALSPYVHFEQFPDYNIQALDRKFEKGMFGKYLSPGQIVQPSSYQIENIPTSSDLKIFQKQVLEGWTDDYAKRWLETYSKEGYDTPFGNLMKNIVEEKLNKNLPYLQYYDGGSLPKFQDGNEYDEDGYKTVTYGANKKKYQDTGTWSEFEPYETYGGKTWRKRTYELSRDDLRYLEYKKQILTDVNYRSGKNNPPKNLTQFIRNTNKPWRVQEIIKDNGATQYVLQYPTSTGSFKTFALGDENSGLANLNPEYVQELKRTGKTGITQFSSWFDMTPQERKDYGYSEWFDKGFTRDLKIDQDGNTRSGWNYYNETAPLTYRLSDVEIRRLPRSIVQKYNLVGNDKMKLDPNTGEIDFLTSTGGLRKAVSQKDMQWFQNPGRLKELATDDRFNYKEDNVLDYLNNPDFRYFADSQKVTLDPVKLDGVPTENDMTLKKPKPYESTITLEPKTLDQIETEREDEIIRKRKYEAPITLDPIEFKGFPDKEQEIIKSNPYESVITLDKKEIEEIPVDEGSLIERRIQETPITLDPINVTSIDSDGTVTTDGSKQRFVPKPDIEADMPDIVLTPEMEEERDKAKTVEDIMGNLQDVRGTTKYVNKSAKAILDAINRDDYTEKDLSRDLGIFEKYYGQENLGYLQDMLDKSQGPKANKGVEVLEDGKFNVKMDRLNNIIDKYYAGEQLSAAENEEIKLYDLRSNDEVDIQPEENNETDLLVDNKSYNLADQIYIYNQYLDDTFTSDDEEKSGNKIVDKINRVYYNKAKQKNMHVYDLLLAIENEMKQ